MPANRWFYTFLCMLFAFGSSILNDLAPNMESTVAVMGVFAAVFAMFSFVSWLDYAVNA